ncbi:hypothetical protein E1A91_A07G117000v1 [Gossypium mustelinum]|uniref:Uncharacterized protein n=1 Tax=Gossypium mustelinum TaxID=34275 RepID=A0A5D2YJ09_GOSMU|nr:hypothetical protein E1A91_A07G117000v1 [Gossypium mustelinum]
MVFFILNGLVLWLIICSSPEVHLVFLRVNFVFKLSCNDISEDSFVFKLSCNDKFCSGYMFGDSMSEFPCKKKTFLLAKKSTKKWGFCRFALSLIFFQQVN